MSGYVIGFRITISDNQSGIDLKKCRYVFWPSKDKIGPTSNTWDEGHLCEGAITSTVEQKEKGKYYIHVLTYDRAGNYTETVLAEPVEWIAKTRLMEYTEKTTAPNGWQVTEGSLDSYEGLKEGTFRTKSLINLGNYSSLSLSINAVQHAYGSVKAYLDVVNSSGNIVKTWEKLFNHGSSGYISYPWNENISLSEIPKGSYYLQVRVRRNSGTDLGYVRSTVIY